MTSLSGSAALAPPAAPMPPAPPPTTTTLRLTRVPPPGGNGAPGPPTMVNLRLLYCIPTKRQGVLDMAATKTASASWARIEQHVDGIVSSIWPKMKELRQEQRLSLQQLAVKAEVSAAAIHKIERSDMVPTITTLLKIAAALDRPVNYFVELDDSPPEPVAFTPASDRPAVFTPHEGLSLE